MNELLSHPSCALLQVPAATPEVLALLTSGLTASLALEQVAKLPLTEIAQQQLKPTPGTSISSSAATATAGTYSSGGNGGGKAIQGVSSSSRSSSSSQRPRTALVTAAAGGTGQFAVQLAKLAGCHVIATCSGPRKARMLHDLGADRVVDYKADDMKAVLKQEYPKGLDLVYESVGGNMFDVAVNALADRGLLIIIGMMSQYQDGWPASAHSGLPEKLLWKSATVAGFFLLRYAQLFRPHLDLLVGLHECGRLKVALDARRFVGLASVADAVAYLNSGRSIGKVVVQMAAEQPPGMAVSRL